MRENGYKSISPEVFAKLGREKHLHEYCGIIFKLLGLVIDYISADDRTLRLSSGARFNPFCSALRGAPAGQARCSECDIANARLAARKKAPVCYRCHAGLHEVVVPLFDHQGTYLGCMTSGQFHLENSERASSADIRKLAEECGLDPLELQNAYDNSLAVTTLQLEGIIEYLSMIGRHLTGLHENLIYMDKINTPAKIEVIKKYMEENYRSRLTLGAVAKKHYISPGGLAHAFKKEMNVTFINYLNSFRVTKARELLEHTALSVGEIAYNTGFGSVSQFNRVFKVFTGKSPGEYRKQ